MITSENIKAMIDHWLSTPVNGYFGQSYGCNVRDQLLKNLSSFSADRFIEKMKADIPVLGELDSSQLSIVSQQSGFENVYIYIKLGNILIEVGSNNTEQDYNQDFYNVTAS